jgi:drug/metabolite transporter (DMT)-like permease
VFTILLSFLLYRGHIDRRIGLAIVFLTRGGVLLVFDRAENGVAQVIGLLAVMAATVSWGVDNTLSRALADRAPGRVLGKVATGAAYSFLMAAATGGTMLSLDAGVGLFLIGAQATASVYVSICWRNVHSVPPVPAPCLPQFSLSARSLRSDWGT